MEMLIGLTLLLLTNICFGARALNDVIRDRVGDARSTVSDFETAAGRERIRAFLPTSPLISYSLNDSNTWKTYGITTTVPIPFKSLYRDDVIKARSSAQRAEALSGRQEILRTTVEIFLDCAIPSETAQLISQSFEDQKIMTTISTSLYAAGAVPQADRVASELQLRQLEAQTRLQSDLAKNGCARWVRWAMDSGSEDFLDYEVASDIPDDLLKSVGVQLDARRDLFTKRLEALVLDRHKLWAKYVPDIQFSAYHNNYFNLLQSGGPPVKRTWSYMVGLTLPMTFPFYDNTDYRREKAQLYIDSLNANRDKSAAFKNWEQARSDFSRAKRRLREIEDKDLALAEAFVQSAMSSYRTGKASYAELVLARRTKLDLLTERMNLKAQKLIAKTVCLTECEHQETP